MTSSGGVAVGVTEASSRVSHLSACSLRRSLRAKASNSCSNLCRFGLVSVGTKVSPLSSTLNSARVNVVPLLLKTKKAPTRSSRRRAIVVVVVGFSRVRLRTRSCARSVRRLDARSLLHYHRHYF